MHKWLNKAFSKGKKKEEKREVTQLAALPVNKKKSQSSPQSPQSPQSSQSSQSPQSPKIRQSSKEKQAQEHKHKHKHDQNQRSLGEWTPKDHLNAIKKKEAVVSNKQHLSEVNKPSDASYNKLKLKVICCAIDRIFNRDKDKPPISPETVEKIKNTDCPDVHLLPFFEKRYRRESPSDFVCRILENTNVTVDIVIIALTLVNRIHKSLVHLSITWQCIYRLILCGIFSAYKYHNETLDIVAGYGAAKEAEIRAEIEYITSKKKIFAGVSYYERALKKKQAELEDVEKNSIIRICARLGGMDAELFSVLESNFFLLTEGNLGIDYGQYTITHLELGHHKLHTTCRCPFVPMHTWETWKTNYTRCLKSVHASTHERWWYIKNRTIKNLIERKKSGAFQQQEPSVVHKATLKVPVFHKATRVASRVASATHFTKKTEYEHENRMHDDNNNKENEKENEKELSIIINANTKDLSPLNPQQAIIIAHQIFAELTTTSAPYCMPPPESPIYSLLPPMPPIPRIGNFL